MSHPLRSSEIDRQLYDLCGDESDDSDVFSEASYFSPPGTDSEGAVPTQTMKVIMKLTITRHQLIQQATRPLVYGF